MALAVELNWTGNWRWHIGIGIPAFGIYFTDSSGGIAIRDGNYGIEFIRVSFGACLGGWVFIESAMTVTPACSVAMLQCSTQAVRPSALPMGTPN